MYCDNDDMTEIKRREVIKMKIIPYALVFFLDEEKGCYQLSDVKFMDNFIAGQAYSWIDGIASDYVYISNHTIRMIYAYNKKEEWNEAGQKQLKKA